MKNPFKRKKDKFPQAQVPRKLEEIKAQYNEVAQRAGQAQYQIFVLKKDLEQLNAALLNINQEAAARQSLDKEEAAKAKPVESSQQ